MGDDLISRKAALAILAPAANSRDGLWSRRRDKIAAAIRALPSATQAGGWMPPDGSVMVPIPIRLAKEFRDHVADEMAAWPDDTAYQDDLRAFASALDAAPLPPAPEAGGWMPPEDRKDGYRCMGFETLWSTVEWREGYWLALTENDDRLLVTPTAFTPLPPAPEASAQREEARKG